MDSGTTSQGISADNTSIEDYHNYYRNASNVWIGHHVSELIAHFGPPHMILDANPRGSPPRFGMEMVSYIYPPERGSAGQCIRAYVVIYNTGEIVQYYCR